MNKAEFKTIIREELNKVLAEGQAENVFDLLDTLKESLGSDTILLNVLKYLGMDESMRVLTSIANDHNVGNDDTDIDTTTLNEDFSVPFKQGKLQYNSNNTLQVLKPIGGGQYDVIKQWDVKQGIEMTPQLLSTLAQKPETLKNYVVSEKQMAEDKQIKDEAKKIDVLQESLIKFTTLKDTMIADVKSKIQNKVTFDKVEHNAKMKKVNEAIARIEKKMLTVDTNKAKK